MKFDKDITKIKRVTFFLRHSVVRLYYCSLYIYCTYCHAFTCAYYPSVVFLLYFHVNFVRLTLVN